ncbi:MAG: DinB family protein [Trueperaceae bacterium]
MSVNRDLEVFYSLARRTRAGVLDWLDTLPEEVLNRKHPDFAFGSLSAIYSHVADTYLWWVGSVGLGGPDPEIHAKSVAELRTAFDEVDSTVAKALDAFNAPDNPFDWTSPSGSRSTLTQRWLILHPITHEFHHKGQALALARVLGNPHPGKPDTDLLEPGP